MYRILFAIWMFLVAASAAKSQTNFYENVSSLWFSGKKCDVLQIAEQRLQKNPNDIAGLLLKVEYQTEYLQFVEITNNSSKILELGKVYTGTNFAKVFPILKADYEVLSQVIKHYPPNEYAADLAKTNIIGKTMSCDAEIRALQKDGYFTPSSSSKLPDSKGSK
jgi:hypothetical protein